MKKIILTLIFTIFLGSFSFGQQPIPTPTQGTGDESGNGSGNGSGRGEGNGIGNGMTKPVESPSVETVGLRVESKPRPNYTDEARKNSVEGVVRLRVTFLASGEIGSITPVSGLPDGLTEQAIAAARQLKFEPMKKNGVAVSSTRLIEYSFSIYFREGDKELTQNAQILEMPAPERPQDESEIKNLGGKVKVTVILYSNGTAQILRNDKLNLSGELFQKISEAVAKIKFNPAIHQSGKAATQTKEIEYEFSESNN